MLPYHIFVIIVIPHILPKHPHAAPEAILSCKTEAREAIANLGATLGATLGLRWHNKNAAFFKRKLEVHCRA